MKQRIDKRIIRDDNWLTNELKPAHDG